MKIIDLIRDAVEAHKKVDFRNMEQCLSIASNIDSSNHALSQSRFIETGVCDGKPYIRKVTEHQISRAIDMSDIDDDFAKSWFYVGDDGVLHPVTVGRQERFDDANGQIYNFEYAASDLIANGEVIGNVTYTDH